MNFKLIVSYPAVYILYWIGNICSYLCTFDILVPIFYHPYQWCMLKSSAIDEWSEAEIIWKIPKRYVVCPGFVSSITDNQVHFINGEQLVKLYKLDPNLHNFVIKPFDPKRRWRWQSQKNDVELHPSSSGNYNLEDK